MKVRADQAPATEQAAIPEPRRRLSWSVALVLCGLAVACVGAALLLDQRPESPVSIEPAPAAAPDAPAATPAPETPPPATATAVPTATAAQVAAAEPTAAPVTTPTAAA